MKNFDVVIVGGGAAGLMAAIKASEMGRKALIIEKNHFCGKKLNITGKGRCNVTNNCNLQDFLSNVVTNSKFMYKAFSVFSSEDVISFFESNGVPLKTERGRRVFPASDKARDITDCLIRVAKGNGAVIRQGRVKKIIPLEGGFNVAFSEGDVLCESVIIATGGASYPLTGSTGDGYALAKELGHSIVPIRGSLVPLVSHDKHCRDCMGLSLKNVRATFKTEKGRELFSEQGEMLFTHFGVTGPLVLSASAHLEGLKEKVNMYIDLKAALDKNELDKRLLKDFSENSNKDFINSLDALLPQKIIPSVILLSKIPERKKVNSITKEERQRLADVIKAFPVSICGFRPIEEAIVTSGGIDVKEINPSTMESKKVKGLYFAGEVIDVDCYTGGYNLQTAFSTGYLAGINA